MPGPLLGSRALLGLVVIALLAGCSRASRADEGPRVVVTTPVLGDVVDQLVGDAGEVEVLIPRGADPHAFQLSAAQARRLHEADLVVAVGLGLEQGMHDVLEAAAGDGVAVLAVAAEVSPLPLRGGEAAPDREGHDHDHGTLDPHFWFDPLRMATAAEVVAGRLAALRPDIGWDQRAAALREELETLDREVDAILAVVPPERRVLITSHDTFGYLADRYGFAVVGAVIPGPSSLAQASPRHLSDLAAVIRRERVPAIFAETTVEPDVVEAVAAEAGVHVAVVTLFTDSLGGDGSGAETYAGMLLTNARRIAEALG